MPIWNAVGGRRSPSVPLRSEAGLLRSTAARSLATPSLRLISTPHFRQALSEMGEKGSTSGPASIHARIAGPQGYRFMRRDTSTDAAIGYQYDARRPNV